MLELFKGLKSNISNKAKKLGNVLFSTDTGQLQFDFGTGTNDRIAVKDPSAAKSISYSNHVITLKDAENNTLSTIDISSPTLFYVDISTGHLIYQSADDFALVGDITVPGNLTVNGIITVNGSEDD